MTLLEWFTEEWPLYRWKVRVQAWPIANDLFSGMAILKDGMSLLELLCASGALMTYRCSK